MHPSIEPATKQFFAGLISHSAYQKQTEADLDVDCLDFLLMNGQIQRYSKELIINELLAHAVVGEMITREQLTSIQSSHEGANFGFRSKRAIDALDQVRRVSPEWGQALEKLKLAKNRDFDQDYPAIQQALKTI